MAYILTCPESEHEMFGEDELESEGDNETNLAVSQDTDIPQLYFVGQDNTAKPVSETLASFVTDARCCKGKVRPQISRGHNTKVQSTLKLRSPHCSQNQCGNLDPAQEATKGM